MPMKLSGTVAGQELQTANISQLQGDLRLAVSSLAPYQHNRNLWLLVGLGATVAVVVFLGWSLFVLGRIKSEAGHVA